MAAARLKARGRKRAEPAAATDHLLWLSGTLPEFWTATQALALRAALGHNAEVFIAGDAINWCVRGAFSTLTGDDARQFADWNSRQVDPEALIHRARDLARIHITACSLSLELHDLKRRDLAKWVDDLAGAASFWHQLPDGRAPWVF